MLNNGQKKGEKTHSPVTDRHPTLANIRLYCYFNKPNYYLNKPNNSASMRSVTLRKSSGLSANSKVSPSMMMSRPL